MRTFDDIPPEQHQEIVIKVLKHCLKNYYLLNSNMYSQSCVMNKDNPFSSVSGEMFNIKLDIDNAIEALPLKLKKIVILTYIMGIPIEKIRSMLGFRFKIDVYKYRDDAINHMYIGLGENWLRSEKWFAKVME